MRSVFLILIVLIVKELLLGRTLEELGPAVAHRLGIPWQRAIGEMILGPAYSSSSLRLLDLFASRSFSFCLEVKTTKGIKGIIYISRKEKETGGKFTDSRMTWSQEKYRSFTTRESLDHFSTTYTETQQNLPKIPITSYISHRLRLPSSVYLPPLEDQGSRR